MSATEESAESTKRKRKFEDDESEEENDRKRKLFAFAQDLEPELLDLADEVLMEILIKLDGESLHNLGLTCVQLKRLIQDKKLWTEAVFILKELDIWEIMKRLKHLIVTTKTLKIQGNCRKENIEKRPLRNRQTLKAIVKRIVEQSPLLQHLQFSKMCFDWTKDFSITKFPANLRSLSFKNCMMPKLRNRRMIRTFTGIVEHMPQLEELRLEYCNFFESNDVMPFSKLQHLKTLSLRGCGKMRNCVPYLSLACRFGFPKLETLDLRETNVSDGEIQCLNAIKSLRELFLEFPDVPPTNAESDDDDDFELFLRGPGRAPGLPEVRVVPDDPAPLDSAPQQPPPQSNGTPASPNEGQSSTNGGAPSGSHIDAAPSTSAQLDPVANIDDAPSSPESFSDSVSSSSSGPDDSQLRTIVIRANINSGANAGEALEPRIQVIFGGDVPHASRYLQFGRNREHRLPLSVSDRGLLGFGRPRASLMGNLVFFGNQPADPNTYLERIILRNFRDITDTTLAHFETNAPRLTLLDIRGCPQISREAVERFKVARNECELISNYDNEE